MATAIDKGYQMPEGFCWMYDIDSTVPNCYSYASGGTMNLRQGDGHTDFFVAFLCKHYTYQVQWRVRRRTSYPRMVFEEGSVYGPLDEVWEDWGPWQGTPDTSDTYSSCTPNYLNSSLVRLNHDFKDDFHYADIDDYDKYQVQVRARAFDSQSNPHHVSEWGYAILNVCYEPVVQACSVRYFASTDTYRFSVNTNWPRGSQLDIYGRGGFYPEEGDLLRFASAQTVGGDEVAVEVASSYVYGRPNGLESISTGGVTIRPLPGGGWTDAGYREVPIELYESSDEVAAPNVTLDGAVLRVRGTYQTVWARLQWADISGTAHSEAVEMSRNGSAAWKGVAPLVPYDVPVRIVTCVIDGLGNFRMDEESVTVDSKGRFTFIGTDGQSVSAMLFTEDGAELKISDEPDRETVEVAGRTRPVARYGGGGRRAYTLSSCVFLRGSSSAQNPADNASDATIERVLRKGDLMFLAPGGIAARVVLNKLTRTLRHNIAVYDLRFEEVG